MGRIFILILAILIPFHACFAAQSRSKAAKTAKGALIAPDIEAVQQLTLARNGAEGSLEITKKGTDLVIKRLFLPGSRIDRPAQACNVEVKPAPVPLTPIGAPEGMARYQAKLQSCPFTLDVLDGAVIALAKPCDIAASHCHIELSGLWGPPALRISTQKIIQSEDQKQRAEAAARTALRRLLDVKPDPDHLKELIRQHVAFKVERDEKCRDYDGESRTGFCAARLSEAHAFALGAEYERALAAYQAEQEHKKQQKEARATKWRQAKIAKRKKHH